jgi:hypothetical protein
MPLACQQVRQLGDIHRNPPRLLFGEQPPSNVLLIREGAEQSAELYHCGSALSRVKLASFAT